MKPELLIKSDKFIDYYHVYFSARFPVDFDARNQREIYESFLERVPDGRLKDLFVEVSAISMKLNLEKKTRVNPRIAEFEVGLNLMLKKDRAKSPEPTMLEKVDDIETMVAKAKADGLIKDPGPCPDCGSDMAYYPAAGDITKGVWRCVNFNCPGREKDD